MIIRQNCNDGFMKYRPHFGIDEYNTLTELHDITEDEDSICIRHAIDQFNAATYLSNYIKDNLFEQDVKYPSNEIRKDKTKMENKKNGNVELTNYVMSTDISGLCYGYKAEWNSNMVLGPLEFKQKLIGDSFLNKSIKIKNIIFNQPATIVFWGDGTKTVVKCMEGVEFNPYYGFLACLGKKIFGTNSRLNNIVKKYKGEK